MTTTHTHERLRRALRAVSSCCLDDADDVDVVCDAIHAALVAEGVMVSFVVPEMAHDPALENDVLQLVGGWTRAPVVGAYQRRDGTGVDLERGYRYDVAAVPAAVPALRAAVDRWRVRAGEETAFFQVSVGSVELLGAG